MQSPRLSGLSTTCLYHSPARCQRYQGDLHFPREQMTEGVKIQPKPSAASNFEEVREQWISTGSSSWMQARRDEPLVTMALHSSWPCSQDADHLSLPVGLRDDDLFRNRPHSPRIPYHIQDRQVREALAVGPWPPPRHRPLAGGCRSARRQRRSQFPGASVLPRRWPLQ